MHFILNPLITGVVTILIAILQAFLLRKLTHIQDENDETKRAAELESDAIRDGLKSLLGDSIDRSCRRILSSDEPIEQLTDDWERIQQLNSSYKALNGNGIIRSEMQVLEEYYKERMLESSRK